jgi:hypothetical protein
MQGAQNKRPPLKKWQPQNARGSKQKTSDKKICNPKTQGAQNKRPHMKKATSKCKGAQNKRPSMKKESTPKCNGLKTKDLR